MKHDTDDGLTKGRCAMDRNRGMRSGGGTEQIQQGWDVRSADDTKLGTVVGVYDDYFVVEKGLIFTSERYIPVSAIRRVADERVYLNVTKEQVDTQDWDQAPVASGTTGAMDATEAAGTSSAAAVRDRIPDRIGTPGLTGQVAEGGREVRAGSSGEGEQGTGVRDQRGRPLRETSEDIAAASRRETGVSHTEERSSRTGAPVRRADEGQTIQLREEELRANTQQVQAGEVEIRKEVVSEQQSIDVPVMREEAVIERHPVEHRRADGEIGSGNEAIRVPLREEQVTVEKATVVTEEISIGKRQTQDTQRVSDTVRREEVRVENQGTARGQGTGDWERVRSQYQSAWQQTYGTQGGRWEDAESSYRYGHEMSSNPRYQGRQWFQVESDLQKDWSTRHRETPWERVKETVRHAWETTTGRR